jgi:hypothetical protein
MDGASANGGAARYRTGYAQQAKFIASLVEKAVTELASFDRESIIIVHGDHGPRLAFDASAMSRGTPEETLPILLAIRWPPGGPAGVQVVSPVNIYREFFRRYVDSRVKLLPDRAFKTGFARPYRFEQIALASAN